MNQIMALNENKITKTRDPWTSVRARQSTVKKLESYKVKPKESIESVIKRAVNTHEKVQQWKKKKESKEVEREVEDGTNY